MIIIYWQSDIRYRKNVFAYIQHNVVLRPLQSDIVGSDIRLAPISLIIDIGRSAHLWLFFCLGDLSLLSCPSFPIPVVLSGLFCPRCFVLGVLSPLSCHVYPVQVVLSVLFHCTIPAILSWPTYLSWLPCPVLSCIVWLALAVLSRLSCHSCPVMDALPRLSCYVVLCML
jgi:hypothetical protein